MNRKLLLVGLVIVVFSVIAIRSTIESEPVIVPIATVNGEPIYDSDINDELKTIPDGGRNLITNDDVLDFLIEKRLLLQQANKLGIILSEEDKAELFLLRENEYEVFNVTIEDYRERLVEDILIEELLVRNLQDAFVLRHEDVQTVYTQKYEPQGIAFEDVEEEIVDFLTEQHQFRERQAYVNLLREEADVIINR